MWSAAFSEKSTPKIYTRKYTGEKSFKCEFTQFFNFNQQFLTHASEKPLKSEMCSDAFSKSTLNLYSRTHITEKPFIMSCA